MKKIILILSLLTVLLYSLSLNAQEIKIHRFQGGYKYTQNDKVIKLKHLANAMRGDQRAIDLAISAKANADLAFGFSFIGGAFIGAPVGKAMAGGDPKWVSAGIGGGLVLIALQLFYRNSNEKAKAAIDMHNANLSYYDNAPNKPSFNWIVRDNGLGVRMSF